MKRKKLISLLASGLFVIIMLLWMSGKFASKVHSKALNPAVQNISGNIVPVRLVKMPLTESAVGTVQAVHETTIASKLLSRVMEMNIKAGQAVKKNDVLLRLDETDLRAKLQQAKSSVVMTEAANNQAVADEKRLGILIKSNAISRQEYDKSVTKLNSSNAELKRAQEAVNESQSILDYATVLSPMDGIVIDKKVDVGDTVIPGQVLLKLFDPSHMQMVASVRESLAYKLKVGQEIGVKVDTLKMTCSGTVSEIVPESSSTSRTFQVKVTGPCPQGIYAGMFGRIYIPLADEQVLVIPALAVRKFGQLEMVDLAEKGQAVRRAIRTGRSFGEDIEILSGLREGEKVAVPSVTEPSP
ncbi:MAG: efflux RND transporter periplasmic adaptor subunit [Lentisphaerae bacterium]|nr:efflux RND transporter periplasmic adaptor subunit [Lentisphaerota bacterium]